MKNMLIAVAVLAFAVVGITSEAEANGGYGRQRVRVQRVQKVQVQKVQKVRVQRVVEVQKVVYPQYVQRVRVQRVKQFVEVPHYAVVEEFVDDGYGHGYAQRDVIVERVVVNRYGQRQVVRQRVVNGRGGIRVDTGRVRVRVGR